MKNYRCSWLYNSYIRDKYFDEIDALPPLEREAKRLEHMLRELPLNIQEEDRIFGWFGFEEEPVIENPRPYSNHEPYSEEAAKSLEMIKSYGTNVTLDRGHVCADYASILKHGLCWYEQKIDLALKEAPNNSLLQAMKKAIELVHDFSGRLHAEAKKQAELCEGEQRERILSIADAVAKVPYYPAETFLEAVQAVWLIHFLIPFSVNQWFSISLGRFDRYMLQYYRKSVSDGVSKEEMKKIMFNFFCLLNSYADGACALNVGGEGDEESEYNELSELIIECVKEFDFPAPILTARITDKTPDSVFENLIDERLFSKGQPTFYSEENCVKALLEKGVPKEQAINFAVHSCMGFGVAGKELNSMWGCVFNLSAALEAVLTADSFFNLKSPSNTEEIFANLEMVIDRLLDNAFIAYEEFARVEEIDLPDIFLSAITERCITTGQERVSGVDYHNVTVECAGLVNVSDGICAIDQLVFREKKYTLDEINTAVLNDFEGYDDILSDLLNCPKYGCNNDEADAMAVRLSEMMQRLIRKHDHDNFYYLPSLHTLDLNVGWGAAWKAGYDGRRSGAPFAKNAGPSNFVRESDPTSLILSASKLQQHNFYGGQPIDIHFDVDTVKNHKNAIASAVRVYFAGGGLQLQVNSLSSEILRKAIDEPEKYSGLIVRIGGYSVYFNSLYEKTKYEFVERFEKEEKR